jgi:hypothetical protein
VVLRRINEPEALVVRPPVDVGLRARPEEEVIKPEVEGRRTAPPLALVVKPPVVDGAKVKLVPVRRTPLEDV